MHPRYNRVKQTRAAPKKANSWLSLFFAFSFGYLFAYIINLETLINLATNLLQKHKVAMPVARISTPKPQASPEPKYEFYTMLQRSDGEVVQPDIKVDTTAADPLATKVVPAKPQVITPEAPVNSELYVVQIAALNDVADAEALKAKLALQGYQIHIVPVIHAGTTVYRVISQDFQDSQTAESWLQKLFTNAHLHGILRKKESISR